MKTEKISNKDIVLFALYELGGAKAGVHTEDIAHRVFQYPIGRQRYRWERYNMYPDKERVSRELRRLKNWSGTAYVKGHVNIGANKDRVDGWLLTPAGVDRVKASESQLTKTVTKEVGAHSVYEVEELRGRIVNNNCYKIYLKDPSLASAKDQDLTNMLYCLPDASSEKLQSAFDELLANAKAVEANELITFLETVRTRFGHLLKY